MSEQFAGASNQDGHTISIGCSCHTCYADVMQYSFNICKEDDGRPLRDILRDREGLSARTCKQLRLYGAVLVNGRPSRLIDKVRVFDRIELTLGGAFEFTESEADWKQVSLPVLYRDRHFVAINKPAGLLSHPSVHEETSVQTFLPENSYRAVGRLDKTTSGVLLFARDGHAHHYAASHPTEKRYYALVHGRTNDTFSCSRPIRRSNYSYLTRVTADDGKTAKTDGRLIAYDEKMNVSLVLLMLTHGRTHQIRVHMLWLGHPLLGDHLYGLSALEDIYPGKGRVGSEYAADAEKLFTAAQFQVDEYFRRAALHASFLSFFHPATKDKVTLTASLPPDFRLLLEQFNEPPQPSLP